MATIETDLKEILANLTELRASQARILVKLDSLDSRVSQLEDSKNKQIWVLILTIMGATIAAVFKFGF
ncbi:MULTISPECIES: hypothetical protein [Synechocystis]|uniref:hypothetical protein n=1 Tax=Synechocystis TaxID=1142 RepID=UPI00187E71BA|nr:MULTISPECIES: hypothetical protein [Synechocystis]